MSKIEIGPRVLTESSTVTTVGFSVKEAIVAEVSVKKGTWDRGGCGQRGEQVKARDMVSTPTPISFFVLSWQDPSHRLLRAGHSLKSCYLVHSFYN